MKTLKCVFSSSYFHDFSKLAGVLAKKLNYLLNQTKVFSLQYWILFLKKFILNNFYSRLKYFFFSKNFFFFSNLKKVIISWFFCFFLIHPEEKYITIEFFFGFLLQIRITSCMFPADLRLQWQGTYRISWWIFSNLLFYVEKLFFFFSFQIHIKIYLKVNWAQLFFSLPKIFSKKIFFLGLINQDTPLRICGIYINSQPIVWFDQNFSTSRYVKNLKKIIDTKDLKNIYFV